MPQIAIFAACYNFYGYKMDHLSDEIHEIDKLIEEFREGAPSAANWKIWREVLEVKRATLFELLEKGKEESLDLKSTIDQLDGYIKALREEEIISTFTEEQIRVVLENGNSDI